MAKTKEKIIKEIEDHMKKRGGAYSDWYVGITGNIKQRLFGDHNVDKDNGHWCWKEAYTSDDARDVEKYFLNTRKTKGGPGGGDDPVYVYAFKITKYTVQ